MDDTNIRAALVSQYFAALDTLRNAVAACPPHFWDHAPPNLSAFWRVAHHTVYFCDFYISPTEADFQPWPKHADDHHDLGPYVDFESTRPPKIGTPTTQAEMLEFIDYVKAKLPTAVAATDPAGPANFARRPFTKLELHVYNIRHIQHHAAQLVARLRGLARVEVEWVGRGAR
jgi:hypothetical protein